MRNRPRSPLGLWLRQQGLTQTQFADLLTKVRGARTLQSSVAEWASGRQSPSDATIAAIEMASRGGVRREQWACWRRRHRHETVAAS